MITPINGHVIVEPVVHESFMASSREIYEEIGIVVALPAEGMTIGVGDKVFFDSWLAARYPKNDTESYWLVNYSDIRAYEKVSK